MHSALHDWVSTLPSTNPDLRRMRPNIITPESLKVHIAKLQVHRKTSATEWAREGRVYFLTFAGSFLASPSPLTYFQHPRPANWFFTCNEYEFWCGNVWQSMHRLTAISKQCAVTAVTIISIHNDTILVISFYLFTWKTIRKIKGAASNKCDSVSLSSLTYSAL